ncbi:MAG: hypothetical protein CMN60_20735 [Sphingobium sp.]|nr:hypothetical protein [Sphingobium sp.]MBS50074.1 hypothetical protein [Sphingobium sp.]|tara:strand:+ start:86839 stop:89094 length:2256 start_codon:yes stop_codon:yes gene_type:complete
MADKDLQFIKRVMERATNEAVSRYHEYLLTEHLLLSLTQEKTFTDLVTRCKGTLNGLITDVETYLSSESLRSPWTGTDIEPKESKRLIELIRRASAQDAISGNSDLTLVSLVLMMVTEERSHSAAYLKKHGVTREKILEILEPALQSGTGTGSNVTDPLGAYCVNLTEQAEKIDPLVGRDDIIDQLVHVLGRRKKSNAILTGEAGVGKTAIVEGLAKRIVDGEIPDSLKDYEIYSLDVAALMAGTKFRGDAEERIKSIIDELCSKDKVILFIDEMHSAMSAGQTKDSALDLGNMLKPKLANGEIKVIGATTNAEYYEQIESDRALVRRFALVDVPEPSRDETVRILAQSLFSYEDFHNVSFNMAALPKLVDLATKYVQQKHNPDRSFDLLDLAMINAKIKGQDEVTDENITRALSLTTGIPEKDLTANDSDSMSTLAARVKDRVFGHDDVIDTVVEAIETRKAGLDNSEGPIYGGIIAGITGTGKTHLVKVLAEEWGVPLLRYDMSEYSAEHSDALLIGAPPGYKGHGEGRYKNGKLVTEVSENPVCVILMDESEKAHRSVYDLFLQIHDHGKLTSSSGVVADFSNTVIFYTGNPGAAKASGSRIGFASSSANMTSEIDAEVKRFFKPELINRVDDIHVFAPLDEISINRILKTYITELNQDLSTKNIQVSVTPDATRWLRDNGIDDKYGARPLKRLFKTAVRKPIAKEVLYGKLTEGGIVRLEVANNELVVNVTLDRKAQRAKQEEASAE